MDFDQARGRFSGLPFLPSPLLKTQSPSNSEIGRAEHRLDNRVEIKKDVNKVEQSAETKKMKLNRDKYKSSMNPFYTNRMKETSQSRI